MSRRAFPPTPPRRPGPPSETPLQTLGRHGRTFRLAGRLLPRGVLEDAAVLYSFCRQVDDLADQASDLEQARHRLRVVRDAIRRGGDGERAGMPAVDGLRRLVARHRLDPEPAERLVDTMIGDLGPVRIADEVALLRYAHGAAGTVGLLMARLLGARDPRAAAHALDLGIAMQLTNIARDVAEDARRDRVYLPACWLPASLSIVSAPTSAPTLPSHALPAEPEQVFAAVARVLELAERYYRSGRGGLAYLPWRARLAIGAAASVYREIGRRVLRTGPGYLARPRCVVPQTRRLLLLGGSLPFSLVRLCGSPHDPALHRALQHPPAVRPSQKLD